MEQLIAVCQNPWCKATFIYTEKEMVVKNENSTNHKINEIVDQVEKIPPTQCPKCRSFNNDLSGGVTWTDKKYEGPRFDGRPHPMTVNVSRYVDKRKW